MRPTILLVEDDAGIADLISRYLRVEQFDCCWANSGAEALRLLRQREPCLVVLDVMLPDLDGTILCDRIRAESDVPIIMVTALSQDAQLLDGFARGIDDYVCKPFNPRELVARIKAVLRRYGAPQQAARQLTCDDIVMLLDERVVRVAGAEVDLTQIEFNLLRLFLLNPNKVMSRDELLDGIHERDVDCYARSVDFHIKNLRRKLGAVGAQHYIKSVYGVGFRFI